MGAFSILIWIGGIAAVVGILSWGEEQSKRRALIVEA
jgi:hypothetical protein